MTAIIELSEAGLSIRGEGEKLLLPDNISKSFLVEWLWLEDLDRAEHIGRLLPRMPFSGRKRLLETALGMDDGIDERIKYVARRWAHLTEHDGKWPVLKFAYAFEHTINTSLIVSASVTTSDVRFVRCTDGVVRSLCEFELHYGTSVHDHLDSFIDKAAKSVSIIQEVLASPLRRARLSVLTVDGMVSTLDAVGSSALPPSEWKLPDGASYIAEHQEEANA